MILSLQALSTVVISFLLILSSHLSALEQPAPKIALVIDDMGHNLALNRAVMRLPGAISYAFLPHARYSKRMAIAAKALKRDVLLHAPMENISQLPLGPGGLTTRQAQDEFKAILAKNIAAIPHIQGVNNHTGSKLTQHTEQMRWTMQVLNEHKLYFLDSRTSGKSVAWAEAKKAGLATLRRDVFLDHSASQVDMEREFTRTIEIAKKYGQAVLIGHPRPASVAFLEKNIHRLAQANIEIVPLSALVKVYPPEQRVALTDTALPVAKQERTLDQKAIDMADRLPQEAMPRAAIKVDSNGN